MISLRTSSAIMQYAEGEKNLLGKTVIKNLGTLDCSDGSGWPGRIHEIAAVNECIFSFPDEDVILRRFSVPSDISESVLHSNILSKARSSIIEKLDTLLFDVKRMNEQQVMFIATKISHIQHIFKDLLNKRVQSLMCIPESYILFQIIKPIVTKNTSVLFVEITKKNLSFLFFDEYGVLHSEARPFLQETITHDISDMFATFTDKHVFEVQKLVLRDDMKAFFDKPDIKKVFGSIKKESLENLFFTFCKLNGIELPKKGSISMSHIVPIVLLYYYYNNPDLNLLHLNNRDILQTHLEMRPLERISQVKKNYTQQSSLSFQAFPGSNRSKKGGRFYRFMTFFLMFLLLAGMGGGGYYLNGIRSEARKQAELAAQVVAPTMTPPPTPSPVPRREGFVLRVLNGTGVDGTAGDMQKMLEELGYKEITTDNAPNFDFKETVVRTKEAKKEELKTLLEQDIMNIYSVATAESSWSADLPADDTVDAEIIVGPKR